MKKMIALGIAITLTLGLGGCNWFAPAETETTTEPETKVMDEKPVTSEIVDTEDYIYDKQTGELLNANTDEVLYENPDHPDLVLYVLGLDGDKLILFKTGSDNSPGPGFAYEVWFSEPVADSLYYLDLKNPEKGLMTYVVPEAKKEQERVKLENFVNQFDEEGPAEPLLYSTDGVDTTVTKDESTFDLSAEHFEAMADECGTTYDADHFVNLVDDYANTPKYTYSFKYNGESQDPDTFTVTVLLNRMEYANLDEVKADFDQCFAGGDMYPIAVTNSLILFESSCGTGFDDGSGNPNGCAEIKDVVGPTLELNSQYGSL